MWEAELQQNVLDASIKGERFKRYAADVDEGRVRVQAHVSFPGDQSPLTRLLAATSVSTTGGGTPVDFVLDMIDGLRIFVGQGYIIRSQFHVVRDGIITDEIEIQIDGAPSVVN
jgi:hypothetical protein